MIHFKCANCGRKIKANKNLAGRKVKCPNCQTLLTVPPNFATNVTQTQAEPPSRKSLLDPDLFEVYEPATETQQQNAEQKNDERKVAYQIRRIEKPPERPMPWPIDIFLYPLSIPGLIIIGIYFLIPGMIAFFTLLLGPFGFWVAIPGFFINIVIGLYMYWYLCHCVRDSAEGGIRAPDVIANAPGLGDMFWQFLEIVACFVFYWLGFMLYFMHLHRNDYIVLSGDMSSLVNLPVNHFIALVSIFCLTVLLFPMGLLAMIMFESICAFNPILIIKSILSTFFSYLGLIIILVILCFLPKLFSLLSSMISPILGFFSAITGRLMQIYVFMVCAHLLGRFFFRYEERLFWDV